MADASANSLLDIGVHGEVSTIAAFPSRPDRTPFVTDSVPTSVVIGPDGAYYVGEFTGFAPPPPEGNANVYRVAPGEPLQVFCSGFNRIIDIAFEADGTLYVLQSATTAANTGPGVLWQVAPPEPDSLDHTCPDRQQVNTGVVLDQPTAIAFGPDGALYISNRGGRPGQVGEVLRIER
jgi:glucose/arabinose dehydrogenase